MLAFPPFNRQKACRYGTLLYNIHDVYVGRSLDLYGEWSEGEVTLFRQIVAAGQTVLEVGANIGAHTVVLAELVGDRGQVLAFEPQRIIYQTLCANLALNSIPNVRTFYAACGKAPGEIVVPLLDYHRENNFGGVSLEGHQSGERVPMLTIDSLALPACHLLKVDAEGMEQPVLEGAAQTIARCRPLLYVENDRKDRSAALIATIAGMGYTLYWHTPPLYNPENFGGHRQNVFGRVASWNMLCVPVGKKMTVQGLRKVEVPQGVPPAPPVGRISNPAALDKTAFDTATFDTAGLELRPTERPRADHPVSLDAARKAHQGGDLAGAVQLYEALLRTDSANAQVWYLLGAARQGLSRLDDAASALREAVRLEPHRAEAHNHLGVVLAQQRHFDQAETAFRRSLELRPHYAETHYNLGLALKELGRHREAVTALDAALRLYPAHADALNNRGVVYRELGDAEHARADFERALELRPDFTRAWANLQALLGPLEKPEGAVAAWQSWAQQHPSGEAHLGHGRALLAVGKLEPAAAALREAVRLQPNSAEAHSALSGVQRQLGQVADATLSARRAIQLAPENAEAFHNLGVALVEQDQLAEAEAALREAIRLRPDHGPHHYNLSVALRRQGRAADACAAGRRAVELAPDMPEAHNNFGLALLDDNQIDTAIESLQKALAMRPGFYQAHNNLGVAWWRKGMLAESEASYRKTIELKPEFAEGYNNIGNVLRDTGRFDEGERMFAEALRLKPDYVDPHWNRALSWLLRGDFAQGWAEYEYRWQLKTFTARRPEQPSWDGGDLAGRTILVHPEQGLGDTLQFVRYLPLVKAKGGTVIFECPKPLLKLLAGIAGPDRIIPQGSASPPFDVHIPTLSLPLVFGANPIGAESGRARGASQGRASPLARASGSADPNAAWEAAIPAGVPYIHADPGLVEKWRSEFDRRAGNRSPFRVAIAWQGSSAYRMDHFRSMPLSFFAPLAKIRGVELISIQKGPGSEQIKQVDFPVIDLGDELDSASGAFMDTAAIMTVVDLVITSDTVIPHLAGALGVPVWMATPFIPDWRWLLDREDSPWYPTLRLFRQTEIGVWDNVFQRLAAALEKRVREAKKTP